MARTGIMFWVQHKNKTADAQFSFSKNLFDHLESGKGKTGKELESEMNAVLDSIAGAKDSETKEKLVGIVQDCFEFPNIAEESKADIAKVADSCYITISGDSISEISKALGYSGENKPAAAVDSAASDSDCSSGKGKEKDSESSEGKEKEKKDEDTDGKGKGTANVSDSAIASVVTKAVNDAMGATLDAKITAIVKKTLGVADTTQAISGAQDDSAAMEVSSAASDMLRECFA